MSEMLTFSAELVADSAARTISGSDTGISLRDSSLPTARSRRGAVRHLRAATAEPPVSVGIEPVDVRVNLSIVDCMPL